MSYRYRTNRKYGGIFRLRMYFADERIINRHFKNVKNAERISLRVLNGLPPQSEKDLDRELSLGSRVFWVDVNRCFTIQPYVNRKHIDTLLDGIGKYTVPSVRIYGGNYFVQDGNHRVEALARLGYKRIPVRIAGYDPSPLELLDHKHRIGHFLGEEMRSG